MIKYCILNLFTYNLFDKNHKNFWLEMGITRVMHVRLKLIEHKIGTHGFSPLFSIRYFNCFVPVIFLLLFMY